MKDTGSARWLRATNGTHIFGLHESGAGSVYDIASGSSAGGTKKLPKGSQDSKRSKAMIEAIEERHIATFGLHPGKSRFSYSAPIMLVDDAIILRSASHLVCIGK